MKHPLIIYALLLAGSAFAPQTLAAQNTSAHSLTIEGTIEGIDHGRLFLIARTGENKADTLGDATFKAPHFKLKAKIDSPIVAQLIVQGYSGGFTMLAEPGATYQALLRNDSGAYIKGGNLNALWTEFIGYSEEQRNQIDAMRKRYESHKAANKFRSASLVNDSLRKAEQKIADDTRLFLEKNDNVITAYTLLTQAECNDADLEATTRLYENLGEGAKATASGRIMAQRIARLAKTAQGRPAPDFTLNTPEGNPVKLSKVKGKIKIVDFWASWCGPCRLNNPALKKAYEQYHPKGLEIVSVSLDNNEKRWKDAILKDGLPWINVSSLKGWKCEVARQYSVTAVPAIYLLDAENRIIATNLRGEQLMQFLKENLE